jgi:hypothetical protein
MNWSPIDWLQRTQLVVLVGPFPQCPMVDPLFNLLVVVMLNDDDDVC